MGRCGRFSSGMNVGMTRRGNESVVNAVLVVPPAGIVSIYVNPSLQRCAVSPTFGLRRVCARIGRDF